MNALIRPCLLLAISMLAVGCSPPSATTEFEGPSFVLTAEEPVAAFEVTLCVQGPAQDRLSVGASIIADARTTAGTATLGLESLADRPADERSLTAEVSSAGETLRRFDLQADGAWNGGGRRCAAPEVVEFSADGLAPGESLEVEAWSVVMDATWDGRAFSDTLYDEDLRVEVERL